MAQAGHSTTVPFLVACTGIATFAAMDGLMKGLSIELGAYNAMLWRTGIAFVVMLPIFLWQRTPWPSKEVFKLHVWRGLIVSVMALLSLLSHGCWAVFLAKRSHFGRRLARNMGRF